MDQDMEKVLDVVDTISTSYGQIYKNKRLYKLLNEDKCYFGKLVLYDYAKRHCIEKHLRSQLGIIVMKEEVFSKGYKIRSINVKPHRLKELADEIIEMFPGERDKGIYYTPYCATKQENSKNLEKKKANGYLQEALDYCKRIADYASLACIFTKEVAKAKATPAERVQADLLLLHKVPPKEISEAETAEIKTCWDISFGHREASRNQWTMFNQLKVLKHPIAISLVNQDFKKLFDNPGSGIIISEIFAINWPKVADELIELMLSVKASKGKKILVAKNSETTNALTTVSYFSVDNFRVKKEDILNDTHKNLLALLTLATSLKYTFKNKDPQKYKHMLSDAVQGYILHVMDHKNLDDNIWKEREKHNEYFGGPYPFIAVCGKSLSSIQCYHAIVDTTVYDFQTVTEAIDFLFKLFHTLNLQYPLTCPHMWSYLHDYLYDMKKISKKGLVRAKALKEFNLTLSQIKTSVSATAKSNQISNASIEQLDEVVLEESSTTSHCRSIDDLSSAESSINHAIVTVDNFNYIVSLTDNQSENSELIQKTGMNEDLADYTNNPEIKLIDNTLTEFLNEPIDFSLTASNDSGLNMTEDDLQNMTF